MKNKHQKLLSWYEAKGCNLNLKINLDRLFKKAKERDKFNAKWNDFIASDPDNKKVYGASLSNTLTSGVDDGASRSYVLTRRNLLKYKSEQLIPTKIDKRPPLLLVFGNPATHSVESGMFFSFEGNKKEHRFWSRILKPAGVLDLPFELGLSIEKLNKQRRDALFNLKYDSPYRIGLTVIISMPSAPGGAWGGIAGVQKLIGAKAMQRLEQAETERVLACAEKFVTPKGAVIAFQKNAWNNLCSENDPKYDIRLAREGKLKGHLIGNMKIPLLCVPPTRLSGPCSRVLKGFL